MAIAWRPVKNLKHGDVFDTTHVETAGIYTPDEAVVNGYLRGNFYVDSIVATNNGHTLVRGYGNVSGIEDPVHVMVYMKTESIVGLIVVGRGR
jgi:hypothetical protein